MRITKILHIPNFYPPNFGGIEDVCHSIVFNLAGYKHKVVCYNHEEGRRKEYYKGVKVIRCNVWKKIFSQPVSFSLFNEMKRQFRTFSPQVVHFHTPNPLGSVYLLATLPRRTKLIVHHHSDIVAQKLLSVLYSPLEQMLLSRADKIIVTSPTYLAGSRPLSFWKRKTEVIPNTVNTLKLEKQAGDDEKITAIRKRYGNRKIVFAFGRNVPYKGFKYLLEASEYIRKDAAVILAGGGKFPSCKRVYYPGRLPDDELRCYLYAADVFAFPSVTKNEAFGIALAEAMFVGLPSVTFTIKNSGVNWVCLDGQTGLEVKNGDSKAFAEAINRLLSDDKLRLSLGVAASERARELFIPEAVENKLRQLYGK